MKRRQDVFDFLRIFAIVVLAVTLILPAASALAWEQVEIDEWGQPTGRTVTRPAPPSNAWVASVDEWGITRTDDQGRIVFERANFFGSQVTDEWNINKTF